MADIAGAILAGGKSSRMGEDKASLRHREKTLLQHMENILSDSGIENIYISHADFIADEIAGYGPLSGIHAVLNKVQNHKHIVFVPVDMPCLTTLLIKKLVSAPDDYALVNFKSHKMPFRLSTDKEWQKLAETLLKKNDNISLGNFQKNIPESLIIETLPTEQNYFKNINTAEEWKIYKNAG